MPPEADTVGDEKFFKRHIDAGTAAAYSLARYRIWPPMPIRSVSQNRGAASRAVGGLG